MVESNNVLEIKNLEKTFRLGFFRKKIQAVKDVSFNVRQGEIFALLGPNGAGKTTTLKIMMGLIYADKGTVTILGENVPKARSRANVGFLPENPYFHEYLNSIELLKFHGQLLGMNSKKIKERSEELIELVGLKDAVGMPLRKFSKGMLQRIGLAQALIAEPKFLILDEPMSGLDPIGRKFVADLMEKLNGEGTTILFSSHILSDVERLCSRVVILNKGVKVAEGTLDELAGQGDKIETLEALFVRKAQEG